MAEAELEEAICRAFPVLLPQLHEAGYRIRSRQAILLGRRIDLLLETEEGETCIVELKAGCPPMPHVRDQILDYANCWSLSFPSQKPPRLLVIANTVPEMTRCELDNFGVESHSITIEQVLAALSQSCNCGAVIDGLKIFPDDLAKVQHLLSDHAAIAVPDGMAFAAPWDHRKVFLALVKRGEKHKDLWKKHTYVQLYPQRPNCAVLYGPKVSPAARGPLHLNPRVGSWDDLVFQRLLPFIRFVQRDNKGPGRERSNFDWYSVEDWDAFASALGLGGKY
jgi:hypothetical protein